MIQPILLLSSRRYGGTGTSTIISAILRSSPKNEEEKLGKNGEISVSLPKFHIMA
jgi:hypothetical protein